MKAITLHQPWATLVAIEAKRFETRSWMTAFSGLLAIHAAKTKRWKHLFSVRPFNEVLVEAGYTKFNDLPFGAVLCVVKLGKKHMIDEEFVLRLMSDEYAFGDYSPGRWAWELGVVKQFDPPISARGYQRLWNWEKPE